MDRKILKLLASRIIKEVFVKDNLNALEVLYKLLTFNNFSESDFSELKKQIIIEERKYKLIKLNETEY